VARIVRQLDGLMPSFYEPVVPSAATSIHQDTEPPPWMRTCRGRAYRDSTGKWWCVTERPCRESDPPDMTCLIFMSDNAARRVLDFPPDWRTRSAADLEAIGWRR